MMMTIFFSCSPTEQYIYINIKEEMEGKKMKNKKLQQQQRLAVLFFFFGFWIGKLLLFANIIIIIVWFERQKKKKEEWKKETNIWIQFSYCLLLEHFHFHFIIICKNPQKIFMFISYPSFSLSGYFFFHLKKRWIGKTWLVFVGQHLPFFSFFLLFSSTINNHSFGTRNFFFI